MLSEGMDCFIPIADSTTAASDCCFRTEKRALFSALMDLDMVAIVVPASIRSITVGSEFRTQLSESDTSSIPEPSSLPTSSSLTTASAFLDSVATLPTTADVIVAAAALVVVGVEEAFSVTIFMAAVDVDVGPEPLAVLAFGDSSW